MLTRGTRPDDRRDAGFTLIELLIAVTILGVVSLALGNAVISYLKHADETTDRLALSHDAQISAAYFGRDVAATGTRDYTTVGVSGLTPLLPSIHAGRRTCGDSARPYAIVEFVSDRWSATGSTPSGTDTVAYYLAGTELRRLTCGVPASDTVLAHYVDPATPSLSCSVTAGCDGAATPQQVTLSFTVTRPDTAPYQITLTGQWRGTS